MASASTFLFPRFDVVTLGRVPFLGLQSSWSGWRQAVLTPSTPGQSASARAGSALPRTLALPWAKGPS